MARGLFVVLEGGEGAGKTTLLHALAARLAATGREAITTREPGGTRAGEQVRALLHEPLTPWAETFAFLLARAQLLAEVIVPALQRGAVVISDRFAASTLAYQGYGRGLDLAALRQVNRFATGGLEPDLTLFLDIDPAIGLRRKRGEDEAIRTGREDLEFHRRVRRGYTTLAMNAPPGAWVTLDASQPPETVTADAWDAVAACLR